MKRNHFFIICAVLIFSVFGAATACGKKTTLSYPRCKECVVVDEACVMKHERQYFDDMWKYHEQIVKKYINKNCISGFMMAKAIDFFTISTGIKVNASYDISGVQYHDLPGDLKKWNEWYDMNRAYIFWDYKNKKFDSSREWVKR